MKFYIARLWIPFITFIITLAAYFTLICRVNTECVARPIFRSFPSYVFESFFLFFVFATPALLLTTLIKPERFHIWTKFTIGWFFFSAVLIAIFPESSHTWMPLFVVSKETVAMYLGATYTVLSSVIVFLSFILPKR